MVDTFSDEHSELSLHLIYRPQCVHLWWRQKVLRELMKQSEKKVQIDTGLNSLAQLTSFQKLHQFFTEILLDLGFTLTYVEFFFPIYCWLT